MFSEDVVVFSGHWSCFLRTWLCFLVTGCVFSASGCVFQESGCVFEDLVVFPNFWLCFLDVNGISKNLVVFLGWGLFLMQLVCRSSSVSESLCKPTDGIHHK